MARFAGQVFEGTPVQQKPVLPSFNAEDLQQTPEMRPGPYYPGQDLDRDKYIRHNPKSGVASTGGQEVALAPAIPAAAALIKGASKAYGAFKLGQTMLDGGRVNTGAVENEPGMRREYNNIEKLGQRMLRNDR